MKKIANTFAAAGLLLLGYWTFECVRARLFQAQEQRRFETEMRVTAPSSVPPPARDRAETGSPVARVEIGRLGLSAMILEGAERQILKLGPAHVAGTALPGDGGNIALAGHRDTFFRPLRFIRTGDLIGLTTPEGEFRYRVSWTKIVAPDEVWVLKPTGSEALTLITCYPFDFLGPAPKRFVVRAECAECPRRHDFEKGEMK
jgi:sortase A